jgi:hypothetical protein
MQRDMSYDLDGMMATRNAGELVAVRQTRTRVQRSPGLTPVARMAGGDVRNLTPAMSRSLRIPNGKPLFRYAPKRLDAAGPRSIQKDFYNPATDLAGDDMPFDGGMGAINLPIVGAVSVTTLALVGVAAFVGYKMFK